MAKKQKVQAAAAKKTVRRIRIGTTMPAPSRDKSLNLMIQLNEPKNIRKDILEALREIIIFMQGYEAFRKIQEEKITTFSQLKEDVRSLNSLIDAKLRRYLPKGKLTGVIKKQPVVRREEKPEEE